MSESFQTVLVKDDRLNCHDSVKYAVQKGGANVTYSDIMAISESNSSHVYNVIVPSETTCVDRRVEWSSEIQFRLDFANVPAGDGPANSLTQPYDLVKYGVASALCAYPLHSCCSVVSTTINNNTISQNQDDVLQTIIRFLDRDHVAKYNGSTPTMPDNYLNYSDGVNATNNVLGAYNNSEKVTDYHARGAFQLLGINQTGFSTVANNTVYTGPAGNVSLYVRARVSEPLMISPFIFGHEETNNQSFYGIQNLNFRMNINSQARIWRQARITNDWAAAPQPIPIPTITIEKFIGSKLTFCYLTPHPEDLMAAKNVVSFLEMPRYITAGPAPVPALGDVQVNTQTLQLNQVPDKLILLARRKNLKLNNPDSFLPIKQVSINWNNSSGILATATQQKLWLMSVENGVNQSFLEWTGQAKTYLATVNGGIATSPYPSLTTPLVGGVLALDFAKDIQITESYYAPGSLGTFQLQVRMTLFNQDPANQVEASDYEIIVITLNSGVFVLERGTASTYTGILTKQDVLDASSKNAYFGSDVKRLVGSGLMDNLKTVVGNAMSKNGGGMSGASEAAGMSGASMSGAGPSGGNRMKSRC